MQRTGLALLVALTLAGCSNKLIVLHEGDQAKARFQLVNRLTEVNTYVKQREGTPDQEHVTLGEYEQGSSIYYDLTDDLCIEETVTLKELKQNDEHLIMPVFKKTQQLVECPNKTLYKSLQKTLEAEKKTDADVKLNETVTPTADDTPAAKPTRRHPSPSSSLPHALVRADLSQWIGTATIKL